MSDYMFMLESHLSANQNRVVAQVQEAADRSNVNLFLTGGAMRDMLGGFPIRDLDFSVEGNALKLAKAVAKKAGASVVSVDAHRQSAELLFPGKVTAEISAARREHYVKTGRKPQVSAATIYEDLHRRDFTFNAMALSLNRASLGLLIDPSNGLADLERREIRAGHGYVFYDDPGRILRLIRFRVRFGFTVDERTQQQYENARMEELERFIPARRLFEELKEIALESSPGDVLRLLEEEKLIGLFSPALHGPKLNLAGFSKLQRVKQMIPFGADIRLDNLGLFLHLLTEKLSAKERAGLLKSTEMRKTDIQVWQKLESRAKKSERELRSAKLRKASQIYEALSKIQGDEVLFLELHSSQRLVQDRIKNYLQKYLPAAQEITDRQVAASGVEPGTREFKKLKEEMIAARLDGRLKKPEPPGAEEAVPPKPVGRPRGPQFARRTTPANNRSQDLPAEHGPRAKSKKR